MEKIEFDLGYALLSITQIENFLKAMRNCLEDVGSIEVTGTGRNAKCIISVADNTSIEVAFHLGKLVANTLFLTR